LPIIERYRGETCLLPRLLAVFAIVAVGFAQTRTEYEASAIASSPDGWIVAGGEGRAWIAKLGPRQRAEKFRIQLGTDPADRVHSVAVGSDGTIYAAGEILTGGLKTGFVAVVTPEGKVRERYRERLPMRAVTACLDGAAYAGGEDHVTRIGGRRIAVPGPVRALACNSSGILFAGGSKDAGLETGGQGTDGYVARLGREGDHWETVFTLGGTGSFDEVTAVLPDPGSDDVFAAGVTNSRDLPVTGAWQETFQGVEDAFVARLRSTPPARIEWATFLGGRGADAALALTFDGSGRLLVAGRTVSPDFPSAGRWNGSEDGFIATFDVAGRLRDAAYAGSTGSEQIQAILVGADGRKHLAGTGLAAYSSNPAAAGPAPREIPTGTTLTTTPLSPVGFGSTVTLRATVAPAAATGNVTFYDGNLILGMAPLVSGIANLNVIPPLSGVRNLRARYNGDGTYDPSLGGAVLTVNSTAGGAFSPAPSSPLQLPSQSYAAITADFDLNGRLDLAVTDVAGSVNIFLGDGAGGMTYYTGYGLGGVLAAMAASDFNNDGIPDLAVVNQTAASVVILLGTGMGDFVPQTPITVGTAPTAIAIADFDLDGDADIAITNRDSGNVSILLGNRNGTFTPGTPVTVGAQPSAIAAGEFSGGGTVDLAVANRASNSIQILTGTGTGAFTAGGAIAVGNAPSAIAPFDFNLDGNLDLGVANATDATISVLQSNGLGGFAFVTGSPFAAGNTPSALAVGDFNADGRPDLAVANWLQRVTVLTLSAAGVLTPLGGSPFPAGAASVAVAVADFDRDGRADLMVGN
jgi:hypothetical protein